MDRCPKCGSEMTTGGCVACNWRVVVSPKIPLTMPLEGALDGLAELIESAPPGSEVFWLYVGVETFKAGEEKLRRLGKVHRIEPDSGKGLAFYAIEIRG
jgi:hypothetical protein